MKHPLDDVFGPAPKVLPKGIDRFSVSEIGIVDVMPWRGEAMKTKEKIPAELEEAPDTTDVVREKLLAVSMICAHWLDGSRSDAYGPLYQICGVLELTESAKDRVRYTGEKPETD